MKSFLVFVMFMLICGCNILSSLPDRGSKPDDVKPEPTVQFAEQDYWDQLAKNVNADVFTNSDDLCSAVDKLQKTGELKDVSRIAEIRKVRLEPILNDAKTNIIAKLKGK